MLLEINTACRLSCEAQEDKGILLLSISSHNLPTLASRIECMPSWISDSIINCKHSNQQRYKSLPVASVHISSLKFPQLQYIPPLLFSSKIFHYLPPQKTLTHLALLFSPLLKLWNHQSAFCLYTYLFWMFHERPHIVRYLTFVVFIANSK